MRQGQGSQGFGLRRRADMSSRKGTGVVALLTGIVGFGLGLFFGWMLHRERVGASVEHGSDLASAASAGAATHVDDADQDVAELRAQLTDAQHMLDESAAAIAELEYQLAECRGEDVDETLAVPADESPADATIDAAADDATTPPVLSDVDIDEADVTEEVVVGQPVDEIPEPERTQQDLSAIHDETEVIPVQDDTRAGVDDTQTMMVDETEAIELPGDETAAIERPSADAEADAGGPPGERVGAVRADEAPVVAEPVAPAVDEPTGDEPVVAEVVGEAVATPVEEPVGEPSGEPVDEPAGAAAEGAFAPPPGAEPDDLQRIRGVGPAMERLLNAQGILTFRQLAVLDDAGIEQLQSRLPGFTGRIRRDRWVDQARQLHIETHGDQP